jgi:hypothetical protein
MRHPVYNLKNVKQAYIKENSYFKNNYFSKNSYYRHLFSINLLCVIKESGIVRTFMKLIRIYSGAPCTGYVSKRFSMAEK